MQDNETSIAGKKSENNSYVKKKLFTVTQDHGINNVGKNSPKVTVMYRKQVTSYAR